MSSYTMELREFVDKPLGMTTREHIELLRREIFDFPYPFYDITKRAKFEEDFVRHFYMREIGFESEHLFKLKLENWLNLNMPYWNAVFLTEGMIKNPLINVDWKETRETERDTTIQSTAQSNMNGSTTATSEADSNTFNRNVSTDTPDSRLQITTNDDGTGIIEYASAIGEDKVKGTSTQNDNAESTTTATTQDNGTSKDKYKDEFHVIGTQGMKTESEMLMLYRETILRIQNDIFYEMNKLFMLVY